MEKQLNLLDEHQEILKRTLYQKKNSLLATIYNGSKSHKPVRKIKKELASIGGNTQLVLFSIACMRRATKLKDKELLKYILSVNNDEIKIINEELRKEETKKKEEIITDFFKDSRKSGKVIYICSQHSDSASDHAKWQGQIYLDRYWYAIDKTPQLREWVHQNKFKTIQWVTGKPVWLITRPNCRHFFRSYTFEEYVSGNFEIPYRKIGERGFLQTAPPHTPLEFYKDRLRLLNALQDSSITRDAINKTKLLITKWSNK